MIHRCSDILFSTNKILFSTNLKKIQKCPRRPTLFELCSLRRSSVQDVSEADNSHLREAKRSRSRARPDQSGQATTKVWKATLGRFASLSLSPTVSGKSIRRTSRSSPKQVNVPRSVVTTHILAARASNTRRPHDFSWAGIFTGRSLHLTH